MRQKALGRETTTVADEPWSGKEWAIEETQAYVASSPARCLIVIDGFVVEVTEYLKEHVSRVTECAHTLNLTCRESREAQSCSEAMPFEPNKMDSHGGTRAGLLVED